MSLCESLEDGKHGFNSSGFAFFFEQGVCSLRLIPFSDAGTESPQVYLYISDALENEQITGTETGNASRRQFTVNLRAVMCGSAGMIPYDYVHCSVNRHTDYRSGIFLRQEFI